MALPLDLIHTTLGRATPPLPESGTKLHKDRQQWAVHIQKGLCCPRYCPVLWTCLAKKLSALAPSRERPWYHVRVVMGVLSSCLAHKVCQTSTI